ncbi:GntR family transcriptional regulator [Limosilactobacillus mucosae]|uniref:GntR family transcriptional regulator n=1 Tax=Limosilactobacillus mucosae TaxID=97478 RepID=A0AAJ1HW22_LIMMU|nr:GntR family transcriptional regulator [Limosilactobacillus mucosae]MDC2829650.1 GntR family transcriptional regulator [Limosilactobacillus mucosae]MDC2836788.1 GntR family transcriptional regulator [Limosilactobacillus mucosae]MDC2848968.1 GntR family transcriptional regulator [Limosilactobacillus mucosae]MDC2853374.1 GntR family transcriptional regulator [Limosilactobacillus mucosae]
MDTNIRQDAYDQIKYNIVHFHYLPRQKVSEKSIAASLQLGRTPVREALIRIEREGLIDVIPQSGTYIATIDIKTAKEGRFVRECIEPQVMMEALAKHSAAQFKNLQRNLNAQKKAAKSDQTDLFFDLDQEFHQTFYQIANRSQIWEWLQLNNLQLNRFRRLRLKVPGLDWQTLLAQHEQIISAFSECNVNDLNYLVRTHLHLVLDEQQKVIERFPNYFSSNTRFS